MKALARRLGEPSTYAGLAAILAALGPLLGFPHEVTTAGVAALGGVAIIVREGPKPGP